MTDTCKDKNKQPEPVLIDTHTVCVSFFLVDGFFFFLSFHFFLLDVILTEHLNLLVPVSVLGLVPTYTLR